MKVLLLFAAVVGCAKTSNRESTSAPPQSSTTVAPVEASSAAAPPAAAPSTGARRYFKRIPVPTASGWRALVLGDRELTLLDTQIARVLAIADRTTAAQTTSFTVRAPDGTMRCAIESSGELGRASFACSGESGQTVVELDPVADRNEIQRIDEQVRALTPPPDICERAERCCKAAWPLLVPGERCDVDFQLGVERYPDTCMMALEGFRKVLVGKPMPAECETQGRAGPVGR